MLFRSSSLGERRTRLTENGDERRQTGGAPARKSGRLWTSWRGILGVNGRGDRRLFMETNGVQFGALKRPEISQHRNLGTIF